MNLIQFNKREDYGREYNVTVLTVKEYALLQISIGIDSSNKWFVWPYMSITTGYNKLFSFYCCLGRVYLDFDLLSRNWANDYFYSVEDSTELEQ